MKVKSAIPILIVCDAENTVKQIGTGGSIDRPINIGYQQDSCIFMITEDSFLVNNQAGAALEVKAHSGDIITWRATTVTEGDDYNMILVEFSSDSPDYVGNPEMVKISISLWQPTDVKNPNGKMTQVNCRDYELKASVLKPNHRVTYQWTFKLVDRDGNIIGYYKWDASINIKRASK